MMQYSQHQTQIEILARRLRKVTFYDLHAGRPEDFLDESSLSARNWRCVDAHNSSGAEFDALQRKVIGIHSKVEDSATPHIWKKDRMRSHRRVLEWASNDVLMPPGSSIC
jgi:hypothetical protein